MSTTSNPAIVISAALNNVFTSFVSSGITGYDAFEQAVNNANLADEWSKLLKLQGDTFDKELDFEAIFKDRGYTIEANAVVVTAPAATNVAPAVGNFATYYERENNVVSTKLTSRTVKLVEKGKSKNIPTPMNVFKHKLSDDETVELKHLGKITAFKIATRLGKGSVSSFVKTANGFNKENSYASIGENYSISFQVLSTSGEMYNSEVEEGTSLEWLTLRTDQIISSDPEGKNTKLILLLQEIVCQFADERVDSSEDFKVIYKNVISKMVEKGVNYVFETKEDKPIFVTMSCEERIANKTHWFETLANVQLPAGKSESDFIVENRVNPISNIEEKAILCYHKNTNFAALTLKSVPASTAIGVWKNQEKKIGKAEEANDSLDLLEKAMRRGMKPSDAIAFVKAMKRD